MKKKRKKPKRRIQHVDRREARRCETKMLVGHIPWALKPRPKGAKKSTGKAELPLSDRVVSNVELRRLGAWRVPADEEERQGGLPAGLRS